MRRTDMEDETDRWSPEQKRAGLRWGCSMILVALALAFILGVAAGAAGMEFLFWKWKP